MKGTSHWVGLMFDKLKNTQKTVVLVAYKLAEWPPTLENLKILEFNIYWKNT